MTSRQTHQITKNLEKSSIRLPYVYTNEICPRKNVIAPKVHSNISDRNVFNAPDNGCCQGGIVGGAQGYRKH